MSFASNFGLTLMRVLGIPIGASYKKADASGKGNSTTQEELDNLIKENEIVQAILDITVSDVCIGSSPIFTILDSTDKVSQQLVDLANETVAELNKIATWIARDLLAFGISVYQVEKKDDKEKKGKIKFFPILDSVSIYLDEDMEVRVIDMENQELSDILCFINYDKNSLVKLDAADHKNGLKTSFKYSVKPLPIQLAHLTGTVLDLETTERAINSYRRQLSKIVRLITVDVGLSQGNVQDDCIDSVSSAVNANTSALDPTNNDYQWDDSIPVLPNRKGLGKPELIEHVPDFDISKLADLDYNLSKLYLGAKFPKTYADFSQALGDTAVSTIRSDIRYSRLVDYCRTKMVDTINEWFAKEAAYNKIKVVSMVEVPSPEDSDVSTVIKDLIELHNSAIEIITNSATYDEAISRLEALKTLSSGLLAYKSYNDYFSQMFDLCKLHFDANPEKDLEEDLTSI